MESTTKTVLMLIVRRAVSALGAFLVAHGGLAAGDQSGAFVEMATGIAVWAIEFGVEWWRKTGMVMVSARVARIKGIPLPGETPAAIAPSPGGGGGSVVVKSAAA